MLIEASALGVPIAAMNTGGTRDIVDHERDRPAVGDARRAGRATSAGSRDDERAARAARRRGARRRRRAFDAAVVVERVERLYGT